MLAANDLVSSPSQDDDDAREVLQQIAVLLDRHDWFEDAVQRVLTEHRQPVQGSDLVGSKIDLLSARELELAERIARGERNREVAGHLGITEGTVKAHLCRIYKRLDISSRGELMRLLLDRRR